jgi:hypothetical protein
MVFVSESETERLDSLLPLFALTRGLLTVSDISDFSKRGGMIELLLEGNKVRFAINLTSAREAGLEVSSKLLQLATRIEGIQ